ncbi:DUF6544 family protein [Fibrobacter succinogenes]|uniref:DUF6544 family protein n=1 Tax=Fibrobacter succinogenes TaxID=833 RepID=UPI0026EC3A8D|nr:DUF6544 family protein [Fibrobacter succinogenes]
MKKKFMTFLIIAAAIILLLTIWFNIPYSPVKTQFRNDVEARLQSAATLANVNAEKSGTQAQTLDSASIANLPPLIQKYLETSGYIGSPKRSHLTMEYKDVDFGMGVNKPRIKIDYTHVDFADSPERLAFIDSKMLGIPFQGYDYYMNGKGGMKGVLAKLVTLFDQTGPTMDKACLITYLAEAFFLPEALLKDFITFKQVDDHTIEATITNKGVTATGIFHFNDAYEMTSFTTNDRGQISPDGTIEYTPWEAQCENYKTYSDGIKRPTVFRAVWKNKDSDFVYFDGEISKVNGAIRP